MPEQVRTVKKIKDGSLRRVREGIAANMVSRGLYEYADDGPDKSAEAVKAKQKTLTALESRPTPTVDLHKEIPIQKLPPSQTTMKRRELESKKSAPPTPNPAQKTIKKDKVPKQKMDAVRALNIANPAVAIETQTDGLSKLVKNAKSKLKKTQTHIPIKVPKE